MEQSRRVYEAATKQLGSFLDLVSQQMNHPAADRLNVSSNFSLYVSTKNIGHILEPLLINLLINLLVSHCRLSEPSSDALRLRVVTFTLIYIYSYIISSFQFLIRILTPIS